MLFGYLASNPVLSPCAVRPGVHQDLYRHSERRRQPKGPPIPCRRPWPALAGPRLECDLLTRRDHPSHSLKVRATSGQYEGAVICQLSRLVGSHPGPPSRREDPRSRCACPCASDGPAAPCASSAMWSSPVSPYPRVCLRIVQLLSSPSSPLPFCPRPGKLRRLLRLSLLHLSYFAEVCQETAAARRQQQGLAIHHAALPSAVDRALFQPISTIPSATNQQSPRQCERTGRCRLHQWKCAWLSRQACLLDKRTKVQGRCASPLTLLASATSSASCRIRFRSSCHRAPLLLSSRAFIRGIARRGAGHADRSAGDRVPDTCLPSICKPAYRSQDCSVARVGASPLRR